MPIDYNDYPPDWHDISRRIRIRARNRCEQCGAVNYGPHPDTGKRVVLTVAHLNHDVDDNRDQNLRALCQPCHLRHDAPRKAWVRKYGAINPRQLALATGGPQ
jgi:5-methylcytosine-specific restriction endonuclease McrA